MTTNRFPGVGYVNFGKDHNFFERVTTSVTTFGGNSADGYQPDLFCTFSTQFVVFILETTSKIVEYSFNGTTVHGELNSNTGSQTIKIEMPFRVVSKIWFRLKSGQSGPVDITVQAW